MDETGSARRTSPEAAGQDVTVFGRTLTGTAVLYAVGSFVAIPIGILSVAVTTRYVSPAQFGTLAVAFAVATLLTHLATLAIVPGTLMTVYGVSDGDAGDDDGGGGDEIFDGESAAASVEEKQAMLATGLLMTLAAAAAFGLAALAAAQPIATYAFRQEEAVEEVRLATACGATGAVWRLVLQVFRMERRPVAFSLSSALRPVLVIILTLAALISDMGIKGVLGATAVGTLLSVLVVLVFTIRAYRFSPTVAGAATIWRRGRMYIVIGIAAWVHTNADVLVLSQLTSPRDVGLYRVASRIGQVPAYITHAFLTAWPPLLRSPLGRSLASVGGRGSLASTIFTYYALLAFGLLAAASLAADALIRVAAESYVSAARLIPVLVGFYIAQALFHGAYRASSFPHRVYWYGGLTLLVAFLYVVLGLLLIPVWGVGGLAAAGILSSLAACGVLVTLDRRAGGSLQPDWRRLALAGVYATGCAYVGTVLSSGTWRAVAIDAGCMLLFPVLLIGTGLLRLHQVRKLLTIAVHALGGRGKSALARKLEHRPAADRRLVREALTHDVEHAAAAIAVSPEIFAARYVRLLRELQERTHSTGIDGVIGFWVLKDTTTLENDDVAGFLVSKGADFSDLHHLSEAHDALKRSRRAKGARRRLRAPSAGPPVGIARARGRTPPGRRVTDPATAAEARRDRRDPPPS